MAKSPNRECSRSLASCRWRLLSRRREGTHTSSIPVMASSLGPALRLMRGRNFVRHGEFEQVLRCLGGRYLDVEEISKQKLSHEPIFCAAQLSVAILLHEL